jgi:NADPH:quinone reductase-like Zn-dependent oxidoreductase
MRAVVTTGHGGLERLEYHGEWPDPEPGPGEVLVAVGACGLNNTDINTRIGWYARDVGDSGGWTASPFPFPRIQGADVCGRVVACGTGAPAELIGARVLVDPWFRDPAPTFLGSEHDGGYAELVVAPAANAVPVDCGLTDVELATFPTSSATALNMLGRAGLGPGETVLVTGASGGVGTALIQVARARGATPIAVSVPAKADALRTLGAEEVIDRDSDPAAVLGAGSIDVVADVVGGAGFPRLLDVLRPGGRYTCAGAIAGPHVDLDLRTMYLHDLTLYGATVTRAEAFRELVALIESGRMAPLVAAVYPLERVREAQEAFLAKRHIGNIVLDVGFERTGAWVERATGGSPLRAPSPPGEAGDSATGP